MNKTFHKVVTLSFLLYIGGFFITQPLVADQEFSELENRNLALRPELTVDNFLDGSFGEDFETYISDQFPGRENFIAIKSISEQLLQKKENNGVYIGDEDYFLQKFESPDQVLLEKNQQYINQFAAEYNVHLLLAPTATKIYEEYLPRFAMPYDEKFYIDTFVEGLTSHVNVVDAYTYLEAHKEHSLYYKTDHHWTTLGAYYAYQAFCESYTIDPIPLSGFEPQVLSDAFYGSLFSKGNFIFAKPDTLEIFIPTIPQELSVYYVLDDVRTDTLYDMSHLEKKDKYSVFLNNNHPIVEVKSDIDNGKKLVMVKDSYANALIPFLTAHFEEIHVLDLRFLNLSIPSYMEQNDISDALILYNVQNFSTENKFALLVPPEK